MASKRHPDQRLTAFTLDVALARALELERKKQGKSRSQFVREAIIAQLEKLGIATNPDWVNGPDRAGNYLVAEDAGGTNIQAGGDVNFSSDAA